VQSSFPPLDYIINVQNFQKIQDCLAAASDMALLTVDFQGTPVTRHSRCTEYCSLVRGTDTLNDLCRKCDARGGLEAARIGKPYVYLCHMGVLDLAIPIVVQGHYIGAVLAGQVIPGNEEDRLALEKIVDSGDGGIEPALARNLGELSRRLPVMTLKRANIVADMIFQITNYIIEEALVKIKLNESWDETLPHVPEPVSLLRLQSDIPVQRPVYNTLILKPAFEYIQHNFAKRITLDEMAALCNISSSYFSKLFNKITGDSFSNYINRVRINRACELLSTTDTPITVIALDLGFEDNSYFDKVFKRLVGLVPSTYKASQLQH
jgi:ligand-binding sensor protein/AraC-like DNA-binding protein